MKKLWELAKGFAAEEDAVGVVEIILILVVLIGLVIIFKEQLTSLVKNILSKITKQSNSEKQSGINPGAGNEILGKGGYLL